MNALEGFISSDYMNAMNYEEFRGLIDELLKINRVTGNDQSSDLVAYTEMNNQRMNRLEKHYSVSAEIVEHLKIVKGKYTFLTITEGWCGDSSQIVPVVEKMAIVSPNIRSLYILRDENLPLMDMFLTNGARSIPITVCIEDASGKVVWHYGPRPIAAMEIVKDAKAKGIDHHQMSEQVHLWYARNRQQDLEAELKPLIEKLV